MARPIPVQPANPTGRPGRPYITRTGNALSCAGRPWKGSIINIAWLGLGYGDNWQKTSTTYFPTHRQVDLAYQQCQALGHNLVRGYSIMPTIGHARAVFPTPYTANETALLAQDYAIARAADYGLYLMAVGCDPYRYYVGGTDLSTQLARHATAESIAVWSSFLGGTGSDFFTNSAVISGYLDHLTLYLRRRNTFNGIRYCDDPTLAFWHLGNEIASPDAWVTRVATHLRTIAPRMLIVDGRSLQAIPAGAIANPDVDVVSRHFYPCSTADLDAVFATAGISTKVVSIDEFDEHNVRGGDPFLPTFRDALLGYAAQIGIVGPWQLGGYNDSYGYVLYPTPGPYVGQDDANPGYDVQLSNPARSNIAKALRSLGYSVRGVTEPAWPVPCIPMISAAGAALQWPGVPGSASYTVERSAGATAFAPVATGVWDANLPWTDPAPLGGAASYRVRAVNPDGAASNPSKVVTF